MITLPAGLRWQSCRRTSVFILMPLVLIALPLSVQARQLRIDTIESLPFGYLDRNGQPTGIMYEIGNRIAEEAGMPYVNAVVPYARTVFDLERGESDFVIRYTNEKLEKVAIQVATIVSLPTIILAPAGSRFRTLADLRGKTVGVVRGGRFDDVFDADGEIMKIDTNNYEQTLRMMMAGRFDAGIGSNVGLYFNAERAGIRREQLAPPLVLGEKHFYLHFSRKTADAETIAAVTEAVKRLQARGEIRRIIQKYVGTMPTEGTKSGK